MKEKGIRLRYLPADQTDDGAEAQPCVVTAYDKTQIRVVPITPMFRNDCTGCVGDGDRKKSSCQAVPNCENAVYVRATPANKIKYIEWLLDKYNRS